MTTAAEKAWLEQNGLYDPSHEHDACGVGFVAHIKGQKSHDIVTGALKILENLDHRGAVGADALMGDGAGILTQIPHKFFARKTRELGFTLPAPGEYVVQARIRLDASQLPRALQVDALTNRDWNPQVEWTRASFTLPPTPTSAR